jgi:UPF0755 protein
MKETVSAFLNYMSRLSPRKTLLLTLCVLIIVFSFYFRLIAPPGAFPEGILYEIPRGTSLSSVAQDLSTRHIIRSEFLFKALVTLFGMGRGALAGDYEFDSSRNVVRVAFRIARGSYDLSRIRVTVPEGTGSAQIADFFDSRFYRFDTKAFLELGKKYEGYLFPDTYYFLPNVTAEEAVDTMLANYKSKIVDIAEQVRLFGKPIRDVIIMASIIEEEARTTESRRIIAGLLWKRLAERMPLQVDATFAFVNGKTRSSDLSLEDLKIDSPYNTYVYKGLPPGPISNPGLDSILATITPIDTKYYFYLSDKDGAMHYAVTHDEHVANKFKYLK